MKKILILFLFAMFIAVPSVSATTEKCGIGAHLFKDPYNKKLFIVKYLQGSSAKEANMPAGSELIAVNDVKVKKLSLEEVINLVVGEENTTVKLLTKYNNKKYTYEIVRKPIIAPKEQNDKFTVHWKQIAPPDEILTIDIPDNMMRNMTYNIYLQNQYWLQRKAAFKNGYDACMTYPVKEQNACLMNLVNREINKTSQDQQLEMQQALVNQQRIQNFTNSLNQMQINNNLNNINNSLQQQNFQLQNINNKLW